jgi:hypothetical protein
MGLIHIRARAQRDVDCLLRDLAPYGPKRLSRRTLLIELRGGSNNDLAKLLSAIQACVDESEIRSLRLDLDGETYALAAH